MRVVTVMVLADVLGLVPSVFSFANAQIPEWQWNPDGTGGYRGYQSPFPTCTPRDPSQNRYTDADRRAYQDWSNAETQRRNEEILRGYHSRQPNQAKPVDPNPYNFAEAVVTPDEKTMLCTKSFQYTYCQ